ncbi:hypothetical protein L2E82_40032 [Cichorium intybus]|uniref:Uncharacterized protein n=1 Tax=Cichorium intybus TaxID=13427 RepID=A0ACB9AJY3_CICIN|nr:hypothetical protein L2E82_40032 [Cichorium intybus]
MISQNQILEPPVCLAASIDSSIIGLGSSVSHLSHRLSPLTRPSQHPSIAIDLYRLTAGCNELLIELALDTFLQMPTLLEETEVRKLYLPISISLDNLVEI